ncbi:hypothetical protein RRG08_012760 [Elysia crispata]|uniref:Uncharacterized protein n=1 Tax=Elysia crispata TaxID=231223 RepID=A0AAE1D382_9GAST|nr:hypothetical protein RRG08_012760 [Elysia crispata]
MFVDINGDYGIPQIHLNPNVWATNGYFWDLDGADNPNLSDAVMRPQPLRKIIVPRNKALHMMQGFRPGGADARTPNQIYTMEQHPGFIKTCAEQDNMEQQQFVQGVTVPHPAFQQAANIPLPPSPAVQQPSTSFQQVFQWDDESKIVILEHRNYHVNMINFLNEMEITGPPTKLPKRPKTK